MKNCKDKSICIEIQDFPKKPINRKYSYEARKIKKQEEKNTNSFKNKLKKVDQNKFKNIPKSSNCSFIIINNENNKDENNKEKNQCLNLLNNIFLKEEHLNNTNIKQKLNESNLKISSLIPKSKKRKTKTKTIKEKESLVSHFLSKNKKVKRKKSFNFEDNNSKSTKKGKYNSSKLLLNMNYTKKNSNILLTNMKKIDLIKKMLNNEMKTKNLKKEEKNSIKKDINNKKNSKKKDEKAEKTEKTVNNKERTNTKKEVANINNDKNRNVYEIKNVSKTEKAQKKKKHKRFPFCCIPINEDSFSDNE